MTMHHDSLKTLAARLAAREISARELCHLDDITALHKALTNYLVG